MFINRYLQKNTGKLNKWRMNLFVIASIYFYESNNRYQLIWKLNDYLILLHKYQVNTYCIPIVE